MIGFDQGSRYHDLTTDEHTFTALDVAAAVDAPLRVRMALLFHDSGKPQTAWVDAAGRKHYYAQKNPHPSVVTGNWHKNLDHEEWGEVLWMQAAKRLGVDRRLRADVAHLIRHHMVSSGDKVKVAKVHRARILHGDEMFLCNNAEED
jgi:hypothetical protein